MLKRPTHKKHRKMKIQAGRWGINGYMGTCKEGGIESSTSVILKQRVRIADTLVGMEKEDDDEGDVVV